MASVELKDLKKSFGVVDVIHDINLSIEDGEFVALVGPSGCGKSTILRIIAGLEHPTSGEIRIDNMLVNALNPRERNVAMVFQNYALYPHMTVAENIGFNLRLSGMSKPEIARRTEEAARMLDLINLLDRRPAHLSGGQRQRVAMGRAIVRDPATFLFDEPLSNLDAKLRVQMRTEIKALHGKVKTTSIYVTHDQIEAMTLADRIIVLNQGRIEQQGSPLELYRRPANTFVAGFIGSPAMNFFETHIEAAGDRLVGKLGEGIAVALPQCQASAGDQVVIGVRPEHFQISRERTALFGNVTLIEPTGAQTHLVVDIGGTSATVVVDGEEQVSTGQTLHFRVDPDLVQVFDRKSGKSRRETGAEST
ncbi:ABC transporter [Devosia geojensis]|uniref:ABC transporter n=1 Tax=Devosia geojensis TaxID=443610 RepID=A0A0F5FUM8_9HYPH|nr:sn-glycerol-3-phosphate ABC transporter ATP-binding protein UgpC [Devosia geojensis]KKB12280.1 ABC transporter [Devosia geojensis]